MLNPKVARFIFSLILVAMTVTGLSMGCGSNSEFPLVGNSKVAGADGMVHLEEIEGGNRMVTIKMNHLPPPDRLGAGMKTYIVWFISADDTITKAGTLGFDPETREANMMATTPMHRFKLKITVEADPSVAEPTKSNVIAMREVSS